MDENNNYIVRGGGVEPEPDPGNDYIGLKRNYDSSDQLLSSIAYTSGLTFPNEVSSTFGFDWTRTGLTITSWNTQRDGSGTSYAVGATIPSASTFWAIWTATADITISYNNNTIVEFSNSDTKILETEGTYLIDDITVEYTKPLLQAKTNITPGTSSQTISPDNGYYGLSSVQINAMPSGTAGTPTASKGTVSNNSVAVTPSVTNVTGYITGGTKTGTAVTVTASELVSGTKSITSSGTTDVTNYASASVAAMTLPTAASSTSTGTNKATIGRSTSAQYINIPVGYNDTAASYTISAVANGSATTPVTTITVYPQFTINESTGLIEVSVEATRNITPTVSAGYVSSGTAGTITVSGSNTEQLTVYDGSHHLAGYPVTISLTNPSSSYAFESCEIFQINSTHIDEYNYYDDFTQIGIINSPTGSTTVTISENAIALAIAFSTSGMSVWVNTAHSSSTGDIEFLSYGGTYPYSDLASTTLYYSVSGISTITFDSIEWDDD